MKAHVTVLTEEAVEALALADDSCVVDATLGSAGHAGEILSRLGKRGILIGIDADKTAIEGAKKILKAKGATLHLAVGNFRAIDSILGQLNIAGADAILADLGWRMEQFSGSGKGFSFQVDEDLLMTLGDPEDYPFVARDIVNDWKEKDIENVLKGYGEERFAKRIAEAIVETREKHPIKTTFDLVKVIEGSVPGAYRHGRIHPATRTFQALRIAVNDEFDALTEFIEKSIALLKPNGRLAIITFHSLEDRIVKHSFRDFAGKGEGTVLTKKPITAKDAEVKRNPRSRSAKLRIFKKYDKA
jgi:16S rRNA (cytosine1402-N4)-methyltransferase